MKTEIVNGIKRITCQILIVGGGPAGGMAAKWCAKGGLDTLLIEKKFSISLSEWKEKNKAEYEQTVGEIQKNYPIVPKDEEEAPKE